MIKQSFLVCIVVLSVIASMSVGCSADWSETSIKMTQKLGDQVAVVLEEYKQEHGTYPENLEDVTSENLVKVQSPLVGNKVWEYVKENDGYYLGVNGNDVDLDPVLYRLNQSNEWYMDTR